MASFSASGNSDDRRAIYGRPVLGRAILGRRSANETEEAKPTAASEMDAKRLISEFFEIFLKQNGHQWSRHKNKDTGIKRYFFLEEGIKKVTAIFNDSKLRTTYGKVLKSSRAHDFEMTDTGIPLLLTSQINKYTKWKRGFSWLTVGAVLMVNAFLILYNVEIAGSTNFVSGIVSCLAMYFTERHLNDIERLGGWDGLCKGYDTSNTIIRMRNSVDDFANKCVDFFNQNMQ